MVSLHSSDFMVSVWKRKLLWRKYPGNDDTPAYCPDVSLPITGLKKTFWEIFWEIFTETGLSSKETGWC